MAAAITPDTATPKNPQALEPTEEFRAADMPLRYSLDDAPEGVQWDCLECPSSGVRETYSAANSYAVWHLEQFHPTEEGQP